MKKYPATRNGIRSQIMRSGMTMSNVAEPPDALWAALYGRSA